MGRDFKTEVLNYFYIYEMEFMKYTFPDPQKCSESTKKGWNPQIPHREKSDMYIVLNIGQQMKNKIQLNFIFFWEMNSLG